MRGVSEGFVLSGEGPTSAPLERSEESGTARHSLRAPAGSICGGPSHGSLRNRDLESAAAARVLAGWLAAPWAADGGTTAARSNTGGGAGMVGLGFTTSSETSGDRVDGNLGGGFLREWRANGGRREGGRRRDETRRD